MTRRSLLTLSAAIAVAPIAEAAASIVPEAAPLTQLAVSKYKIGLFDSLWNELPLKRQDIFFGPAALGRCSSTDIEWLFTGADEYEVYNFIIFADEIPCFRGAFDRPIVFSPDTLLTTVLSYSIY